MKVTLKQLKGENFDVEIDGDKTVGDLKKLIASTKPEFPADLQKLIHAGKVLVDDAVVKDLGIQEGQFVVIMAGKPKAPAGGEAAPAAAAPAPAAPAAAPVAPPSDAPVTADVASSNLMTGAAAEATLQQLCDMGFSRPEVERAFQAAFHNPDRAVEYLMNGIPEGVLEPQAGAGGGAPPQAGGGAGGGAPPSGGAQAFPAMVPGGGGGGGDADGAAALEELRNHPQFAQLAQMVAQNPQVLAQILPAVAQTNPGLVQAISQNPEPFMRMLQEAAGGGGGGQQDPVAAMLAAAQQANGGGGAPGGGGQGGAPPGQVQIRLSPEEQAAVARLCELGFDRGTAAQAYLACDKNEELAANFLFENAMDTAD